MNSEKAAAKPKISVVMPTYNRARYVAEAIKSVQNQTLHEWELIVIDDGSTDGTEAIVQELAKADPRIRYIRQGENLGIAKTRNHGVALAQADYIAMLDSDDVWISADKLTKQISFFEQNKKLGIVGTNASFIDENGRAIGKRTSFPTNDPDIRKTELYRNMLMQSGLAMRKEAIDKAGGYDPRYAVCDDHDLWLKIGRDWQFMILPSTDLSYRIHKGGITKNKKLRIAREETKILFKFRSEYPGFWKGLIKCSARFFVF